MSEDRPDTNPIAMTDNVIRRRINKGRPGFRRRIQTSEISPDRASDLLQDIARTVDRYFDPEKADIPPDISVSILKSDPFSSVIRVRAKSCDVVIKKEHARSKLEFLTKGFRKSRAAKAWEKSQLLAANNIDIAYPIALIEDFFLFFRTNAYFICTCLPGTLLRTYLDDPRVAETDKKKAAEKTIAMISRWHGLGITHGDPKASNLIINNSQLHLIDTEDVACRPSKKPKTRTMARDWAIVLHNWQNQPDIRQMALAQILTLFDTGQHQLATRLIKKFWKTEPLIAKWPVFKETAAPEVVKKLAAGQLSPGWKRSPSPSGIINAVCDDTGARCLFTRKAFPSAKQPADYFQKKRLPRRGIFSMALSMRICGFCLPDIIAGGFYGKHEYLLFNTNPWKPLSHILEEAQSDKKDINHRLILLGAEMGRFHAMGFIHGNLSLNTVGVNASPNGYAVVFPPGPHTHRPGLMSAQKKAKDWDSLRGDFVARLSPEAAAVVFDAYEKASHRK